MGASRNVGGACNNAATTLRDEVNGCGVMVCKKNFFYCKCKCKYGLVFKASQVFIAIILILFLTINLSYLFSFLKLLVTNKDNIAVKNSA